MRKHLSMCAMIRERGRLRGTRLNALSKSLPPAKIATGLILLVFFLSLVPSAKAEPPVNEKVVFGTWSNSMPSAVQMSDDIHRECDDENVGGVYQSCGIEYKFLEPAIDSTVVVLTFEGHSPNETLYFELWDGTKFMPRLKFDASATDYWFNYTFADWELELTGLPRVRFGASSVPAQPDHTADIFIDVLSFRSWTDLSEMEKELDRLRRRLDEIDEGIIIVGENEPYVPPTREGLESDPSGYFFVDPFWTIFYSWYDSKSVGASMSFVACYDSGWSDYEALEDELYIAGSYTTLWLNSSGSEVLNTTDAYTYYRIPDANAGDAYTVETSGGNIKTDRYCRMKRVETFSWMVSEDKKDYKHTFALTNDLSIDWRNVLWVIAADPDTTMDQSTVVVTDTTTNTELDPGKHYEITPSCIRFQLSYHNQTVSESYEVTYSIFQEGSDYQEPRGIFHHNAASSATLNNRVFLYDQVSISNPNSIKCSVGTRISIDFSSVPGSISEIFVITADGSYLEQGPPLGNDWYSFYGLEIPASSVVTVSVYVKVHDIAIEAEDLRPIGLLMFTVFFILTIASIIGWIGSRSDKKLHKWTETARGISFIFALLTAVGFVVAFWSYG